MKKIQKIFYSMNLNVLSQLITIFLIVSVGPAIVAYLASKKAL